MAVAASSSVPSPAQLSLLFDSESRTGAPLEGHRSFSDLVRMVECLKEENRILREKLPKRIEVAPNERSRLVRLGEKLGSALNGLIGIVTSRTFRRWLAKEKDDSPAKKEQKTERGRPRNTRGDPPTGASVRVGERLGLHASETRHVRVAGITAHPNKEWMVQRARNLTMFFDEQDEKPQFLLRDLDTKYVREFDAILEGEGVEVIRVGPRAPNLNAHAERVVQTLKSECLDHFICFGEAHLRHILSEYLEFCHTQRPHQGKGNNPLTGEIPDQPDTIRADEVVCEERLGGLLKSYQRAA